MAGAMGLGPIEAVPTRQAARISAIAASVVKSLFPIRSITSLPLAASRRRVAAVTPPPGKAVLAATSRRSGVSLSTTSFTVVRRAIIGGIVSRKSAGQARFRNLRDFVLSLIPVIRARGEKPLSRHR